MIKPRDLLYAGAIVVIVYGLSTEFVPTPDELRLECYREAGELFMGEPMDHTTFHAAITRCESIK